MLARGGGGTGGGGTDGTGGSGGGAPFELTSPAFEHVEDCSPQNAGACELFPEANVMETIGGDNMSPEFNWGPGPVGTMSYAIVLQDLSFNDNAHWAMWNIPAGTLQLPANLPREQNPATPAGSQQVSFSGTDNGYQGPGANGNVYEFRLYALNVATFSPQNPDSQGDVINELLDDPDGIVLEMSALRARSSP